MPFPCPICDSDSGVMVTKDEIRKRRCKNNRHVFYTQEIEFVPVGKKISTLKRSRYADSIRTARKGNPQPQPPRHGLAKE